MSLFDTALTEQDKVSHWLVDGTAKDTRVEVTSRSADADLVVVDTAETVGETRGLGVEPVVVRDTHAVLSGKEAVLLRLYKLVKVDGTSLLHTLEDHLEVDGKLDTELLVRLKHVEPAHDGSLVVGRSASVEAARAVRVGSKLEWLVVPSVLLERRLNIVVTIDEEVLLWSVNAEV